MSTVFDVPCPGCGRPMSVEADELQCSGCQQAYHLRMGHLFPAAERAPSDRAPEAAGPATPAPS
jgi:hypothetical protein